AQWLRLFRPARAPLSLKAAARLLGIALAVGLVVAGAAAGVDYATRETLYVPRVATAPDLNRLLDDPAWRASPPVSIRTLQGANLGGTGA
ncbi:hypothetical protein J8J27_28205, partial [Mycobacterium tuberculosis]|nr:hypothetical protein [Mycobacterium tuberculosis]